MTGSQSGAAAEGGRPSIDLNADLGEGGLVDDALMEVVSSASIACGFHAGGPELMAHTCRQAVAHGVSIGAHPSYDDREGFGRRDVDVDPEDLVAQIAYQVGALRSVAELCGGRLGFVKAHGALYNRAAADPRVGGALLSAVASLRPRVPLLGLAGSELSAWAGKHGVDLRHEAFADRAYLPDGRLAPRSEPDSVMVDPSEVAARAVAIATSGTVTSRDGAIVEVRADSICVHGDTPGALVLARAVRDALESAGVAIRSFA